MQDEDYTITPFDPADGIWFKYGRVYSDRDREIAAFEAAVGHRLPRDFLSMIGEYCEGGFDGHYRVHVDDGVEVEWHHLLLMKLADEHDAPAHDTMRLLRARTETFGHTGSLKLFPFGEATAVRSAGQVVDGYLAFDVERDGAVVFTRAGGGGRIGIAPSFRQMMLGSSFAFYG